MGCRFSEVIKRTKKPKVNKESKPPKEKSNKSVIKILLLGAAESGKTTIAKQMKILHGKGYQNDERLKYLDIVQKNILDFVKDVLYGMKSLNIKIENPDNQIIMENYIKAYHQDEPIENCVQLIKKIIQDEGFKNAIIRGNEFQMNETHVRFLYDLDRITATDYLPTDDDILKTRMKTTGIFEYEFNYKKFSIKLIDVGGQRGQRKKWINSFEDVNSMIYVTSLTDYCMVLEEDSITNRLVESVKLFSAMCSSPYFEKIPIILFLNKKDLFENKIKTCPLQKYFPKYEDNDFDSAVAFIQNMFLEVNTNSYRPIYVHITNATDKSNINFVFDAVCDIILNQGLKEVGIS